MSPSLRGKGRLDSALKEFSQRDADSLLAAVGYGIVSPAQLLGKVLTADELKTYRADPSQPPNGTGESAGAQALAQWRPECGHRVGRRRHDGALCPLL